MFPNQIENLVLTEALSAARGELCTWWVMLLAATEGNILFENSTQNSDISVIQGASQHKNLVRKEKVTPVIL